MNALDSLLNQIDVFIRKYYKNEMVKGMFLALLIFITLLLTVTGLEYLGRFNSYVRGFLFFSFVLVNAYVLIKYFLAPLFKLFELGKRINRLQAARIIGSFFPEISDRLVNTLQLSAVENEGNLELIRASVIQRSRSLSVFKFDEAIDQSRTKKLLRWLAPAFLVLLVILLFLPGWISQGTERVVRFDKEFIPPAPFQFNWASLPSEINEGDALKITVRLQGNSIPEKVFLQMNGGVYLMNPSGRNEWSFEVPKVTESLVIKGSAAGYVSNEVKVKVLPKAIVGKLKASLVYPAYLGKENESIDNATDLVVPEGTVVSYSCLVRNIDQVSWISPAGTKQFKSEGFEFSRDLRKSEFWKLKYESSYSNLTDSLGINISVIKDQYPSVVVSELVDSNNRNIRYFKGDLADDYGLRKLSFVYEIESSNGKKRRESVLVLQPRGLSQGFNYAVDFGRENISLEDRISYWFEVVDNDGVNGGKLSKSQYFSYRLPNLEELNDIRDKDRDEVAKEMDDLLRRSQKFQKDIQRINKSINNSKSNSYSEKNELERLLNEQNDLQKDLLNLQKQMEQSTEMKNQLSEMDPDLLEKQQMIEELMKNLLDDEMLDLLKKLEELMDKGRKEEMMDALKNVEQSAEDQQKALDRTLEMLKKLEVNEKIDDVEKELKALAEEQDQLRKDGMNKDANPDDLQKKQDELNKRFDELKEEMKKIDELNNDLQRPMDLDLKESIQEKIDEEMKSASDKLGKSKKSGAQEDQKNAKDDLEKLAEDLNEMQEEANQTQDSEDVESLKRVLKNLMTLSFDQESNMRAFVKVQDSDPNYRVLGRKQRTIIDDTKIVQDSLFALAKRQPKIASFVDAELTEIRVNHELAVDNIDEHRKRELNANQQLVMTSYNNLALLLNEALESMQSQMQSESKGKGQCEKPGGSGRPKPGNGQGGEMDMKQMLKKQLEQMQKGMSPGGNKPGSKPGSQPGGTTPGQEGMGMPGLLNKEIAKMVGEQTMIRQRLEQLRNELNKDGQGKGNQLNPLLKELEEQERALLNKNFSPEMIKRQKDILSRLLESEKAMMERGFDEKRESKEGKDKNGGNKIEFEEYNKEKLRQIELLRPIDPVYKKYYKDRANEYFNGAL